MPWEIVTNNSEVLAIHAALLPTNQVLIMGGSEHNAAQNQSGNPADLDNTRLFHLSGTPLIETIGSPNLGEHGCWIYHPRARTWRRVRDFNFEPGQSDGGGRWYPTLLTLANGEVLAVAGHPFETDSRHNNDTPERYASGSDTWSLLTAERLDPGNRTRYYPRFHLLPDGNVFFASPVSGACRIYHPFTGQTAGATIPSAGGGLYDHSWDYPSILLPLLPTDGYKPRVMICGDTNPKKIDLSQASPGWQNTAARAGAAAGKQRRFSCSGMLPTGEILSRAASTAVRRIRMRSRKAKSTIPALIGQRVSSRHPTAGRRSRRLPLPVIITPRHCCCPTGASGSPARARMRTRATRPQSANRGSRSSNRTTMPTPTARN